MLPEIRRLYGDVIITNVEWQNVSSVEINEEVTFAIAAKVSGSTFYGCQSFRVIRGHTGYTWEAYQVSLDGFETKIFFQAPSGRVSSESGRLRVSKEINMTGSVVIPFEAVLVPA